MITIHNLEVRFDVEGDDDRQAFAKLFNEFINKWSNLAESQRQREIEAARERSLSEQTYGAH
ncbi:putative phage tail protein [Stieleria varia]|uniref:Uncharacterized protein n=1 Tax=Stieleria varia TaxID=2528005 RepID=A0A5C5ZWX8_9BACT|nr:hypothetical protein [Stieleria varia]TWT91739.1 hypothetical protein Pla52n_64890 [Stieleria varia]